LGAALGAGARVDTEGAGAGSTALEGAGAGFTSAVSTS
jgi:hypothetical protein